MQTAILIVPSCGTSHISKTQVHKSHIGEAVNLTMNQLRGKLDVLIHLPAANCNLQNIDWSDKAANSKLSNKVKSNAIDAKEKCLVTDSQVASKPASEFFYRMEDVIDDEQKVRCTGAHA